MPAILDTSVLVRYLTLDPPHQGREAEALIDGTEELCISSVALAEAAFVLTSVYHVERSTLVDSLIDFLGKTNVDVLDMPTELALEALLLCRPSGRVSFADALIWAAAAREPSSATVYTFDRSFPDARITRRVLGRAQADRTDTPPRASGVTDTSQGTQTPDTPDEATA